MSHWPGQRQSVHNCTSPSPSKQSHAEANHPRPLPSCLALPPHFLKHIHTAFETSKFHILPLPSSSLLLPTPASSELGLAHLALTQDLSPVLLKPKAQCPQTQRKVGTCSLVITTPLPMSAWQFLWGERNCRNPQAHLRPSQPKQVPVQRLPGCHRSPPLHT